MPILIAQNDRFIANRVAHGLAAHFPRVAVVENVADPSTVKQFHRARVAVLDLELFTVDSVKAIALQFCNLIIVCTHRSPDEQMWIAALNAGAVEVCHPSDIQSILRAARRIRPRSPAAA